MKKLGMIIGLTAMAMSAGVASNPVQEFGSASQSANEIASQKTDNTPVNNQNLQNDYKEKVTIKNERRSNANHFYRGEGIPPKVNGMNYVKRGTHKRTNV